MLPDPHFYWKITALAFYNLAVSKLPTYQFLSVYAEHEGKKCESILILVGRFKGAPYPLREVSAVQPHPNQSC